MKTQSMLKLVLASIPMLAGSTAFAEYPNKPITLLVGYPPGGAADLTARLFAEELSKQLKQTVVVENKPGAGGTISTSNLARAKADGYTLGIGTANSFGVDQFLYRVKYTREDFTPISQLVSSPLILAVNKDIPADTVGELKALIKKSPNSFNYSSSGIGGSPHIAGLMFEKAVDENILHIPYKGGSDSMTAIVSGEVKYSFGTAASVLPLGRAGRYKMMGVTSYEKSPIAPDLPSLNESGMPGFTYQIWFGLLAPKGLPDNIADKLFDATQKALSDKEMQRKLLVEGNIVEASASRLEFKDFAIEKGNESLDRLKASGIEIK
ncbi:ABC transporter substrate-binding protein [Advenella sp. S44]|uniref:Bug family tripartite tricarboxylate transporter substrate binding protein n=1 Tax=Advenella sp. S44 TaxID=1982755 RepID=UPI000C2A8688|nr:tripartite tricarboxylate transporter substrate binding protein [Advenella sp. S44]PJX28129.1 ABC transporter substrate-binding protein [Advenella sp. S44]